MQTLIYFLLWGGFFFMMMRFGCGAHIMCHGHPHAGIERDKEGSSGNQSLPAKVVDPVCGMSIETVGARTFAYRGNVYHFCSQNCREKFEASPQTYLAGKANRPLTMESRHEHNH